MNDRPREETERELEKADELLRAAATGAARCLCHGHRFDGTRTPVVIEKPGGTLEVACRTCAEHYSYPIVRSGGDR